MTFFVRLHSFLAPLGDGDVGTYFHVANGWLHGSLPYVDNWEYKPPGLFAMFAVALALTGSYALASALLSAIAVFAGAVLLMLLTEHVCESGDRWAPVVAALFFIFLSTENEGLSGDAELYIGPFIAAAFLALTPFDRRVLGMTRYGLAGLAAGMALQMMLLAAPECAVVAAIVLFRTRDVSRVFVFLAAACTPVAAEALLYARAGALANLYDANVLATVRRMQSHDGGAPGRFVAAGVEQVRILGPALELAPLSLLGRRNAGLLAMWAWLAAAFIAILSASEFYNRHFLLLAPPLSILGALGVSVLGRALRRPKAVAVVILVAAFLMHDYFMTKTSLFVLAKRAYARQDPIANDHYLTARLLLRNEMGTDRSLYVVNESPLLYDELSAAAPTRYAFSSDLFERAMWPMLGETGLSELVRILDTKPHYILAGAARDRDDSQMLDLLHARLNRDYAAAGRADGSVLYRLKALPAGPT